MAAALAAAERTFSAPPTLPLRDDAEVRGSSHEGRRRLAGAFSIAISRIRPDPNQPRRTFDEAALAELTASIRQHGILQPIAVRYSTTDDVYFIIAGERRFQAALAAGIDELPCWIRSPRDGDILVQQIVENWQRADLHPFDLADALARLRDTGSFTQKDLAHLTGKSAGEISKLLSLLEFDAALQRELRADPSGALSKRHLYEVRKLGPVEQRQTVATIRERGLSAEATEHLVAEKLGRRTAIGKRGKPVTRVEFATAQAKVTLIFRRQHVSSDDILTALEEARRKVQEVDAPLNIIAPKSNRFSSR